jgi:hypothetical protein
MYKNVNRLGQILSKNSPTILTGLSVAGLITTTVMAVKATPRAIELIEDEKARLIGDFTKKDTFAVAWKCYIPSAIMGVVTIGCIISANSINLRRNAALAGLYSLSERSIKEYQSKVIETIGDKKHRQLKEEVAVERMQKDKVEDHTVINTPYGNTLCYDAMSGRYFKSDIEKIRQVLNKLSRDLLSEHFITLNEIYSDLGLQETKVGEMVGWHVDDGLIDPLFNSQLTPNGEPCLVMDFHSEPRYHHFS